MEYEGHVNYSLYNVLFCINTNIPTNYMVSNTQEF